MIFFSEKWQAAKGAEKKENLQNKKDEWKDKRADKQEEKQALKDDRAAAKSFSQFEGRGSVATQLTGTGAGNSYVR